VKVLIASTPGAGHVHPLVPIATALQRAGHEVTWTTAPGACRRVESLGFAALPAGMDVPERRAALLERCPEITSASPRQHRALAYRFMFGAVAAPAMFDDLEGVLAATGPDVVLHEPSELATPPAAAARGIPSVGVGFGDLIPEAIMAGAAEEVTGLWAAVGLPMPDSCGLYQHLYLHQFPPGLSRPIDGLPVQPMRPLAFDGRTDDVAPEWTAALGSGLPCLYATFGTEFAPQAPLGPLLAALDGLPAEIVLTVGPQLDAADLGPVPPNVRVEQYVPQRFVLAKATAMVSHAGSGAVLGAAEFGLPQLCLPLGADQFDNADAVGRCGMGLALEPHEIDADALRRAIEHLLADGALRRQAGLIAAEIEAMPPPDDLVGAIEALAR
jgi:UDP:flavonoid glycosyltransferase YjiC (YdhE family)